MLQFPVTSPTTAGFSFLQLPWKCNQISQTWFWHYQEHNQIWLYFLVIIKIKISYLDTSFLLESEKQQSLLPSLLSDSALIELTHLPAVITEEVQKCPLNSTGSVGFGFLLD